MLKLKRRFAVPAGAVALMCLWWAATARRPVPVERPVRVGRDAPTAAPDRPALPPQAAEADLPAPEPVMRRSAQRRFSNPSSHGAADGGIAGAETADTKNAARAAHLSGGQVNMPGGYAAPTASIGRFSPPDGTKVAPGDGRRGPDDREGPGAPAERPEGGTAPEGETSPGSAGSGDKKVTDAGATLVSAARDLKTRGDAAAMRANSSLEAGIMRRLALDNKVDAGIRGAIDALSRSGRPVTPEAVAKAVEGVMKDNGLEPEDEDMEAAVARASGPPPPDVPPAAYAEAVKNIVSAPALPPAIQVEIQQLADLPPPPRTPAPRGALDAYRQNQGVFDKALKDFGVKPEHILGILGVETAWGRNTGKYPLPGTLKAISGKKGPDGRPTKAALQAGRDLAALVRLSAQKNLGGLQPDQIRGSHAGAMGTPQFLPTSWEAYSRAPDGGKRDPFNFGHAAYSVGNYLKVHGYGKDVPRSIWGYNHSQEYVDKVMGLSASVKASLPAATPPAK